MSPMQFLRQIRLERAHQQLLREDPRHRHRRGGRPILGGFDNLGRFSQMYRHRYGRLLSHTLRD